jgi:predicted GIY-YIG superfamily endonuclease
MSASASDFGEFSRVASSFFVYIVRCNDGSFYVGHTSDVPERVNVHNKGLGALWTAFRRPVVLVYQEFCSSKEMAVARERQIKRWTHDKKLALINGDLQRLKSLAKRRKR